MRTPTRVVLSAALLFVGGCCFETVSGEFRGTPGGQSSSTTGGSLNSASGASAGGASGSSTTASSGSVSSGSGSGDSSGSPTGGSTTSGGTTGRALLWLGGVGAVDLAALEDAGTASFVETCLPNGFSSAFDPQGNLWVEDQRLSAGSNRIVSWTPAELAQGCVSTPASTADEKSVVGQIAIDSQGYLWEVVPGSAQRPPGEGELDGWDLERLRQGVDLAGKPDRTLKWDCSSLFSPCQISSLAVGGNGYLWLSGSHSVVALSPKTIAGDGGSVVTNLRGDLFLSTQAWVESVDGGPFDIRSYNTLAFDPVGNLWATVLNLDGVSQLVEFTAAQLQGLAQNPTPEPKVVIAKTTDAGFDESSAMRFDEMGDLWIRGCSRETRCDGDAGVLFRVVPAEAAARPPDRFVVPTGNFGSFVFSPHP